LCYFLSAGVHVYCLLSLCFSLLFLLRFLLALGLVD
jgi:hypothetical protein